ncbi:MAG: ABC transporter ATP-binding protein [Candidatus Gastranaerophilales bacterium]|nr:ABC transporter ATP-binding protein [Candidatus Gastranaerophilales bacterium]
METLLEIKNLEMKYAVKSAFSGAARGYVNAVNNVSFEIKKGEILGLVGESGCGKSTLGRCLLALEKGFSGEILFQGENILNIQNSKDFRKSAQMIFQNPYASLNPRMKIYDILKEPLLIHGIKDKNLINQRISEVCELTGIDKDSLDYYPHEFSGGQRQRISIASAIILKPEFIVADEPVSALDVSIRAQIINLLKELQEKLDLTILFISHDLSVVRYISDRTAVMYLGEIVEFADNEELFQNPKHPYTEILLSSVPKINREQKEKMIISGDIPSPRNLPEGCKFHTRCGRVFDRCKKENPKFLQISDNHFVKCNLYEA